jgi:alpha-ketoglutarate-dependent taurine dioxygenase
LFPDYLVLFCVEPARTGGITVISDCRRVLGRVRAGILKKQTYQGLFDMRAGARAFGPIRIPTSVYKARGELSAERWEGSRCPIVLEHPRTGEASFSNHLVHDGMFRPHRHFGDGSVLKEADHFHIWKAHVLETTFFTWKRGDLLILDNRLVAHSGTAFNRGAGQKRELRVAIANAPRGKGEAA